MRIIIETDSKSEQQPEVKKISAVSTEQDQHSGTTVGFSSSPMDAGHARIPDGYANSNTVQMTQQLPGHSSVPIAGAIDAGAAKVQQETIVASAMPDTGNMETFNTEKAFPAGAFVSPVSN